MRSASLFGVREGARRPLLRRHVLALAAAAVAAACTSPSSPAAPAGPESGPPRAAEYAAAEPWTRLAPPRVFAQAVHSEFACGPAALATALAAEGGAIGAAVVALGDTAVAHTVAEHGSAPSEAYGDRPRFDPASGTCAEDLLAWLDDWRAQYDLAPRAGLYLDRVEDEAPQAFVARVHGILVDSLRAGAAPVVRLRSFAPQYDPQRGAYLWFGLVGHWVVVVGAPSALRPGARGFAFEYADPATGAVATGWVHAEDTRPFAAAKGNARDWVWLTGNPFLLATVPEQPTLALDAPPWFLRTIVTLDHALVAAPQPVAR